MYVELIEGGREKFKSVHVKLHGSYGGQDGRQITGIHRH